MRIELDENDRKVFFWIFWMVMVIMVVSIYMGIKERPIEVYFNESTLKEICGDATQRQKKEKESPFKAYKP